MSCNSDQAQIESIPKNQNPTDPSPPQNYGTVESTSTAADTASPPTQRRVVAPDLLRGLLMVLQALDHCAVSLGSWRHGVALESEADGTVVHEWNHATGWIARMLTHLCAPGFMFLMGMGIVYYSRSRQKLGWTMTQLFMHFLSRSFVLALINELIFSLLVTGGRIWILNIVLLALAVNYLLAGIIFVALSAAESALTRLLEPLLMVDVQGDEDRPLLDEGHREIVPVISKRSITASTISWHVHNIVLAILVLVTIGWNNWLSPDGGRCLTEDSSDAVNLQASTSSRGVGFDFWFFPVMTDKIVSPFPPLAWLSFVLLGLLYTRIVVARPWAASKVNLGNAAVGLLFVLVFVLTRLLRFGNLSEQCLRMPEELAHPTRNQYLASLRSFFYIIKYPPSFAYFAYAMAVNFFLLAIFGTIPVKYAVRIPGLLVFGTSALFFYVLHILLYGGIGTLVKMRFGHELGYTDPFTGKPAVGVGNTPVFWIVWVLVLLILYPLCRAYSWFKSTTSPDSIWRLF